MEIDFANKMDAELWKRFKQECLDRDIALKQGFSQAIEYWLSPGQADREVAELGRVLRDYKQWCQDNNNEYELEIAKRYEARARSVVATITNR